jgi:hypothetical protein
MAWRVCHRFIVIDSFLIILKLFSRLFSATIIYFLLMIYIVLGVLKEVKPVWFFVLAFFLFVLSQLDFFLLNKVICKVIGPFCMIAQDNKLTSY